MNFSLTLPDSLSACRKYIPAFNWPMLIICNREVIFIVDTTFPLIDIIRANLPTQLASRFNVISCAAGLGYKVATGMGISTTGASSVHGWFNPLLYNKEALGPPSKNNERIRAFWPSVNKFMQASAV